MIMTDNETSKSLVRKTEATKIHRIDFTGSSIAAEFTLCGLDVDYSKLVGIPLADLKAMNDFDNSYCKNCMRQSGFNQLIKFEIGECV